MPAAQHVAHPGLRTPPAVPASTVALTNPFPHPCLVQIRGGTVTAIAVAGQSIGLLAGLFLVGVGETITLTYTVAPAWKWYGIG